MRPCGWLQVYGGVFHVANLKESSNPHYILREFLVHSADEVSSQWAGLFDLQSAGAPSPPHRRVMPDKCASITSRHGRTTECHMSQAPPWASCRYTQWPSPQWRLHAPQCDYYHCTPPPPPPGCQPAADHHGACGGWLWTHRCALLGWHRPYRDIHCH